MYCGTVNRGLAYADGKVFLQQAHTTLVALDAKSSKKVWNVKNGAPKKGETNTNAPVVVKDMVLTVISDGEFGVRGFLAAYNIKDGSLAWKYDSTGPDKEMCMDGNKTTALLKPVGKDSSLKSWKGDQRKIGGGTTWGWYTYDPELNLVYYASGNESEQGQPPDPGLRPRRDHRTGPCPRDSVSSPFQKVRGLSARAEPTRASPPSRARIANTRWAAVKQPGIPAR
jgi:glucose dehydrogenase